MNLEDQITSRRLSQLATFALFALTYWTFVSRPGVIGDEFAGEIYAGFVVFTLVVFGVLFLLLRFGAGGSTTFWSIAKGQLRPIGWMILTFLAVMQVAGLALHLSGLSNPTTAFITYLLAGTLVPAAFLQFGLIAWPVRLRHASWFRLSIFGAVGFSAAALWSYQAFSLAPVRSSPLGVEEVVVTAGSLIVAGTLEEILFRVLLLTALLARTGSRLQAVFLSSVAFGLMHVPGALVDPALHADWDFLGQVAFDYAPEFLLQTLMGMALGVLWLRTGSITLISLTHAMLNLGTHLAVGLLAYG